MKTDIKDIQEIKDVLKSKIFAFQNRESYIFEDDAYAILPGDFSLLIRRKYKYYIFQYESNFIFRTHENEISPKENEFIISISRDQNETYTITFFSLEAKSIRLRLHSD